MKTNAWPSRLRRIVLVVALALAATLAPLTVDPAPAQAAPAVGFNPGNIISDSLFYNGSAMTAAEVQGFLDQRVPRCTIGDPGRTAGSAWGNTYVAGACLRNFSMATSTKSANANCAAYVGRQGESAAEIITKVGQACGISQRVLLITLEKEQSLVSDTWPTLRQFDVATGYACPDSGPGNSANCDATYAGFFNQVYLAAWQLKNYKLYWSTFAYKPFQTNTIQWHPNPDCGASSVYIENWATAALYIYTPYRPNQAALDAGWGTGDACSSYGNRNFYLMYTTWFGNVQGYEVHATLQAHYDAHGAETGVYGAPAGPGMSAPGGGVSQAFNGGILYWSPTTGFGAVNGAIRDLYLLEGGITGYLGYPIGAEERASGVSRQEFQGGTAYWTNATGASVINGAIRTLYLAEGGPTSYLGYPVGPEVRANGASRQEFQGGTAYWTNATGASVINGAIRTWYLASGGPSGSLGYPIGSEVRANGGASQQFQYGSLRWTATGGIVIELSI